MTIFSEFTFTWAATTRDVANSIPDADLTRPERVPPHFQVQVNMKNSK